MFRVVTKISSFSLKQQVGRESNRYMGISVGSVFLLFFVKVRVAGGQLQSNWGKSLSLMIALGPVVQRLISVNSG